MNQIDNTPPAGGSTIRTADTDECQLQTLYDGADTLGWRDRLHIRLLRARSYVQDHLEEAALRLRLVARPAAPAAPAAVLREPLKAGDVVEVLSLADIRRTLDEHERCAGLKFMKPMAAYCGQRFVVQTNVRRIYNERHERMLRLRRTVLLRNVLCDGRYLGDREGCDRCCFFFWKEDWLRKVAEVAQP